MCIMFVHTCVHVYVHKLFSLHFPSLFSTCRHGLYRTDFLLYNDPELSFLTTVPQSALFIPTCNNNKEGNSHKVNTV